MAQDPLRYFLDVGSTRYELKTVKGVEGVSKTARFEVTWHVDDTDTLDPDEVVSTAVNLTLMRGQAQMRSVALYVTNIERSATRKIRGRAGGGLIEAVLEPRLAMLRKRTDIRVFRDKTAAQIVSEVLQGMGVEVETRLRDTYVVRPYCVQFRESDYDFAARLLEDDGIFYFVNDQGVAVLGDHPTSYDERVASLPFRHGAGLDDNVDSIHAIGQRGTMTAGKVSLRDFNHEHPSLNMDVSAEGPTEGGAEWYDYPGEYLEPAEGQIKAKKRAEALACVHQRMGGESFCALMRPGARFQLDEAPMGIREGGYVLTQVSHDWQRDKTGFLIGWEALRESTTYRPEVKTFVPTEPNPLTAYTTGPAGADIHTDKWGQVKVWFPWDRLQPRDDRTSHWVPILQDNTGKSSGIMRTAWEVVCQFLEGDPDRPVIVGRVFNPEDPIYTPLPANKTRTSLRSLTSPRTEEGSNYIDFDDLSGKEAIMISAHRDQNIVVGNDKNEQVDNGETNIVGGNETIKIGNEQRIAVARGMFPSTNGNQTKEVGGDNKQDIGLTWASTIKKDHKLTIGGNHKRTSGASDTTQVGENLKETIGGSVIESSLKGNTCNVGVESTLEVTGSHTELAKQSKVETTKNKRQEHIHGNLMETVGKEIATRVEDARDTQIGQNVKVDAKKNLLLAGAEKLKEHSATATMTAETIVTLKVGNTQIKMHEGRIEILAPKNIKVEMSGNNTWKASTAQQDPARDAPPPSPPPDTAEPKQ